MQDTTVITRPLSDPEFDAFYNCWVIAYSDYKVPLQITKDELKLYAVQNGVDFAASAGAFVDDKLVGFLVNGIRKYDGVLTAYDAGTAIIPEYRGKGISTKLFTVVEKAIKQLGVKRYQLEVICDNEPAYKAYLKNGFSVSRDFECFKVDAIILGTPKNTNLEIVKTDLEACLPLIPEMLEYKPSWHNTIDAAKSAKRSLSCFIARLGGEPIGYGLFQKQRRRIVQLGAAEKSRQDGVYEALIGAGCSEFGAGNDAMAINLPVEAVYTKSALKNCGFRILVSQYEMVKLYT